MRTDGHASPNNYRMLNLKTVEAVFKAVETLKWNKPMYHCPLREDIEREAGLLSHDAIAKSLKLLFETGIIGKDHNAKGHDASMRLLITKDAMTHVRYELFLKGKVVVAYPDGALIPRAYYYGENLETLYIKDQTHKKKRIANYEKAYAKTEAMWLTDFKLEETEDYA